MITFPIAVEMPRIYTAVAESAACIIYILPLKKRFANIKVGIILAIAVILQIALQSWAGTLSYEFWIPGTIINIAFMFIIIYVCGDVKIKDALYWCAHAVIAAEVVASVEWQIYCMVVWGGLGNNFTNALIFWIPMYTVMFILIFILKGRVINSETGINITTREVLIAVIVGFVIYTMSNIGFVLNEFKVGDAVNSNLIYIRSLVDVCGFCILFIQQNQRHEAYLRKELQSINNIFELQYGQYLSYKENSEFINRKCHDLKHQIDVIRLENDEEKRESYLKEMEVMVKNFKSNIVTGSGVLDTILTNKNTYCIQHNIDFTVIADGKLLSFLETLDICSIFGNALDNAIECVEKINDFEKRMIKLNISSQKSFLLIGIENYCEDEVNLSEGLPDTTKKNRHNHGYGLKSIRHTVEKYNGTMTLQKKDNWFVMNILIPM